MNSRIRLGFAVFFLGGAALAQTQLSCTPLLISVPKVRQTGFSELTDLALSCSGGTPTAAGTLVPQFDITLTLNTTVTSRLIGANAFSEALLVMDIAFQNQLERPLLNCGAPGAPDDDAGNNGPTGTSPGVCGIRSTGVSSETYDGTPGTPGVWGTGRPNVFQGRITSANTITFAQVPIDPPGFQQTRFFRFRNIRISPANLPFPLPPTTGVTASVSGGGLFTGVFQNFVVATPTPAMEIPVNSPNPNGVNTLRLREGYPSAWMPRNIATLTVNDPSVPANGGDFGVDITTLYEQNYSYARYGTEEGLVAAGRPAPPGFNNPGAFSSSTTLNTARAGMATHGSRVAVLIPNAVPGYSIQVPQSIRLVKAGTNTPTGIAQLVLSEGAAGDGGVVLPNRDTSALSTVFSRAIYEIVYSRGDEVEDLLVPVSLVRNIVVEFNPTAPHLAFVGMAPYYPFTNAAVAARTDAEFPTPRFGHPNLWVALSLGTLTFDTPAELPLGAAGSVYQRTLAGGRGTPPYAFSVTGGALPPGMSLNSATGGLSGTPASGGTFTFAVEVRDWSGATATRDFTLKVLGQIGPANSAQEQPLFLRLNWANVGIPYRLFFGTTNPPPELTITSNPYYDFPPSFPIPGQPLLPETTYYWAVRSLDGQLTTPVWSFRTVSTCPALTSPSGGLRVFFDIQKTVTVTAGPSCTWTPVTDSPSWILLGSPGSVTGSGMFSFNLALPIGPARFGKITVGTKSLRVLQSGVPIPPTFGDVTYDLPYFDYASLMYQFEITAGCSVSPLLYCPLSPMTRSQMAVFVVRALNKEQGTPLMFTPTPYFEDMPASSNFFPFVQRIRDLGITAGCSTTPALFCPNSPITHGQMAVFMIAAWMRVNGLTSFTHTTTPYFTDVPPTHPFFRFIQKVRDLGIRTGCTPTEYCDGAAVTRGEAAPMLLRAILGAP